MNTLYYGDNLKILQDRNYFPDACVDLVYLGPPFDSNPNYNVLFKNESGIEAESQITAFEDTRHWNVSDEETRRELRLIHVLENIFTLEGSEEHEIVFFYVGEFTDRTLC